MAAVSTETYFKLLQLHGVFAADSATACGGCYSPQRLALATPAKAAAPPSCAASPCGLSVTASPPPQSQQALLASYPSFTGAVATPPLAGLASLSLDVADAADAELVGSHSAGPRLSDAQLARYAAAFEGPAFTPLGPYVDRLMRFAPLPGVRGACGVAVALLLRLRQRVSDGEPALAASKAHRLALAALLVAAKLQSDAVAAVDCDAHIVRPRQPRPPTFLSLMATVGGVSVAELAECERDFLYLLDFDAFVGPAEHDAVVAQFQDCWNDEEQ